MFKPLKTSFLDASQTALLGFTFQGWILYVRWDTAFLNGPWFRAFALTPTLAAIVALLVSDMEARQIIYLWGMSLILMGCIAAAFMDKEKTWTAFTAWSTATKQKLILAGLILLAPRWLWVIMGEIKDEKERKIGRRSLVLLCVALPLGGAAIDFFLESPRVAVIVPVALWAFIGRGILTAVGVERARQALTA